MGISSEDWAAEVINLRNDNKITETYCTDFSNIRKIIPTQWLT